MTRRKPPRGYDGNCTECFLLGAPCARHRPVIEVEVVGPEETLAAILRRPDILKTPESRREVLQEVAVAVARGELDAAQAVALERIVRGAKEETASTEDGEPALYQWLRRALPNPE